MSDGTDPHPDGPVEDGELEVPRPTVEIDGVPCDLERVKDSARRIVLAIDRIQRHDLEAIRAPFEERLELAEECLSEIDALLKGQDA